MSTGNRYDEAAAAAVPSSVRAPRRKALGRVALAKSKKSTETRKGEAVATLVRQIRERAGHTQRGFWPLFGVSQTAGCRYESNDRETPLAVLMLVVGYDMGLIPRGLLTDLKRNAEGAGPKNGKKVEACQE